MERTGKSSIRQKAKTPFRRRLPLVASLLTSLVLAPCATLSRVRVPFTHALAYKAFVKREEKKKEVIMLVESLRGGDVDVAVEAARKLGLMGEDALPDMLALIGGIDKDLQLSRRALTVLLVMEWEGFSQDSKMMTVDAVSPMLMRFDSKGRTMESHLSEWIMLNIGDESMPTFIRMLRKESELPRMMALSALMHVDWRGIQAKHALVVREALSVLERKSSGSTRRAAKEVRMRIDRIYVMCMNDDKPLEVV
jgi:hypothetical protein